MSLNDTLDHMDITDIYRLSHSRITEYTFFTSSNETVSKTDHTTSLNNPTI